MKSFRSVTLAALAMAAAVVCAVAEPVFYAASRCCSMVADFGAKLLGLKPVLAAPADAGAVMAPPAVMVLRMRQFVLRQIKRDKMEVRPGYRLVPSV